MPKNIRHDQWGTQAHFKTKGHQYTRRWKASEHPNQKTRETLAKDWLRTARASVTLDQPPPDAHAPRFDEDADAYLDAVTSMPSYTDRKFHIQRWCQVFAGRDRQTITPLEIRHQLERWRKTLSGSSCDKRRTALMSFYTWLNGKSGYNPVRDVPKYNEEASDPRAQHPVTILRVLTFLRPSKTRARLRVMLATGWPHAQIKKLKAEHIDFKWGRAYVTPRRKGKGVKGRWLPLLPSAIDALREFVKENAFGEFSHSAMHKNFTVAVGKLNAHRDKLHLPPLSIRPYDIRHSALTWLAHRITDERALQEFALHSRIEQTRRYTEAATAGRLETALAALAPAMRNQRGLEGSTVERTSSESRQKPSKKKRARQVSNLRPPA